MAAAIGWTAAMAQTKYTKRDSGWAPLFNGKDFSGLYIRNGNTLQDPARQASFLIEDSSIRVPRTGGVGHLATQAIHSRYHVRVKYRFGKGQGGPNAGLLYHIDTADWKPGLAFGSRDATVPYFFGSYVKSVELQMYRGDAGAFLGIMNIWVTADTRGDANHTWQPGGTPYTAVPSDDLSPRRIYRSQNAAPNDTDWVLLEGLIYGADSVTHRVNGVVVMKGRNLRHNRKTAVSPDTAGRMPMASGHIGLQTEGAEVWYRDWELRRLRADGTPLIPGCMNSSAENFNALANEDDGSCRGVGVRQARSRAVWGRAARSGHSTPGFAAPAGGGSDALGRRGKRPEPD